MKTTTIPRRAVLAAFFATSFVAAIACGSSSADEAAPAACERGVVGRRIRSGAA